MTKHSSLRSHIDGHAEANKNCDLCGKWLATVGEERLHMRDHRRKNDPFIECSKCSFKNRKKEVVAKHEEEVHGPYALYSCQLCNRSYRQSGAVKKHRASNHHREMLEKLGLVDVWLIKEKKYKSFSAFGGSWRTWGKMAQFVTEQEAARIMCEDEKNTTYATLESSFPSSTVEMAKINRPSINS